MEEEIRFLLLTIVIELPIILLIARKALQLSWWRIAYLVVCINLVTHPLAWYLILERIGWLPTEIIVTLFEALVFMMFFPKKRTRVFAALVLANMTSALIGLFLF